MPTTVLNVRRTRPFSEWLDKLHDQEARLRITARIRRIALGLMGDTRFVGDGVHELRIDHGPGYRVYYLHAGSDIVLLLCGGDKRSQARDIGRAKTLAKEFRHGA